MQKRAAVKEGKQKKRKVILLWWIYLHREKNVGPRGIARTGSWKPKLCMSDHSVWSRVTISESRLLVRGELSTSCWFQISVGPLLVTAEAGAPSGEEMATQEEWRWTWCMTDPCSPGLCWGMPWVRGTIAAAPKGRHNTLHLPGFLCWPYSMQILLSETWGSHTCTKLL